MIKLAKIPTNAPKKVGKEAIKKITKDLVKQLGELQHILYAQKKYSVLVVLQGMDATGKDGAARKVFAKCSHTGVRVESFKKPTEEELAHDFLWRIHQCTPEKGMVQIFNRSHYEDVVIQKVHKWINEERVSKRLQAINAFEELLQFDNDTVVIKFYMHISQERQMEKLQERINDPSKNWKHNESDWEETKLWDEYLKSYENAINKSKIPWHIVPVDQRWYRDYYIAKIMVETLTALNLKLPVLPNKELLEENG
ncbi:MAG: polyphosphate kinase [Saprospiraceae bacterium]|nr:polyphosphate kinase [Saprospiraceae bacterium]